MRKPPQAVDASILFIITNIHNECICNQIGKVLWGFEVIWVTHNSFVQICWIQADPKLEIA